LGLAAAALDDPFAGRVVAEAGGGDPPLPGSVPVQAAVTAGAPRRHHAASASRSSSATYSVIPAAGIRRQPPCLTDRRRPVRIWSYMVLRLIERMRRASGTR